jgi:integrase
MPPALFESFAARLIPAGDERGGGSNPGFVPSRRRVPSFFDSEHGGKMEALARVIEFKQKPEPRRKRGEGRIYHPKFKDKKTGELRESPDWWIQYYQRGRQVRESSLSENLAVAERLLRRRLGEAAAGILPPPRVERVRYEDLRDVLLADYQANGRKWLRTGKDGKAYIPGVSTLDDFFAGFRAVDISTDRLREFIRMQQESGSANGTVNRSLALLRRMFKLAIQDGKLKDVPFFPMLKEAAPRKGFLEHADFQKLRTELPEYLRPILTMGYFTGMRLGEILGLRWSNVSFLDSQVRLDPGTTKNDDARTIPLTGELLETLKIQRRKFPNSEFVFMRDDERISSFRKAWTSACDRAKLPGLLFHDLRRTGVRNLVRAGVPERVAMMISGHRQRQVFERYNIVSDRDLKLAASKLEAYLALGESSDHSHEEH